MIILIKMSEKYRKFLVYLCKYSGFFSSLGYFCKGSSRFSALGWGIFMFYFVYFLCSIFCSILFYFF